MALMAVILIAGPVRSQSVELTEEQYDQMKAEGTLPDEFHVAWSTLPPPAAHPSSGSDNGARAGGDCDCWKEPDNTYTLAMNPNDDGSSSAITLPFQFNLYGDLYNTCFINNNGNVTFNQGLYSFSAGGFPAGPAGNGSLDTIMVAPFWADVDTRGSGTVKYKLTSNALYVNWTSVGYYNQQTDKLNSFQLIISDGTNTDVGLGSTVSFCYREMEWTTGGASGGTGGFGGTPATVGANRGNGVDYIQFGRFNQQGSAYNGPSGLSGVGWLTNKSFVFTTAVSTQNIPPITSGTSLCDTLNVCTNELVVLDVNFLSPEPDQLTTASYTITPPLNATITETNSGPANTVDLHLEFIPTALDVGLYVITFTATDDGAPPLTSTVNMVIRITLSPELISDTLTVCDNIAPFDLITVLGGSAPDGGSWMAPNGSNHSGTFNPAADAEGNYIYSVSTGGFCPATGTATMYKIAHADAGGDTSVAFCSWDLPDPLFPLLAGDPHTGGSWFKPDGAAFPGTIDPATADPGIYKYVVYGEAPCPNDTAFLSVAIPRSVDAGISNEITFCVDADPFSMRGKLGGTPDATGHWTDVNGASLPDLFDPVAGDIGLYTYTVSAVLPCPDQSATLLINIDVLPHAGSDSTVVVCANDNDVPLFPKLGNSPDLGGHWLDPLDGPLASGIVEPALEVSGKYRYVVIGPGTCEHRSDTAVVDVLVNPLPVISFTAEPDSGCAPLQVTFTNTTDSRYVGPSCVWDFGDGTEPEQECAEITHTFEEAGWYHLKLRVTTPEGCTDQLIAPGAVLVDPKPEATFVYTPNPGSTGYNRLVFTATDPRAVQFQWTMPDGTWPTGQQVAYTFPDKISDSYPVCLYVVDRYGCEDTFCDTLTIRVPNLWVPNAFTPDGNNINDLFKPIMLDLVDADYRLQIFDRWGRLLFETTNPEQGWDGTAKGSVLPTGVYVWRVVYRPVNSSDLDEQFGTVTLNK